MVSQQTKGVIFDWDGTLVDTVRLNSDIWHDVFMLHGVDVPSDKFVPYIGKGGRLIVHDLFGKDTSEEDTKKIIAEKGEVFIAKAKERGKALLCKNAQKLLRSLHEKGIKIGVGTANTRHAMEINLESTGIKGMVDCLVTVEDIGVVAKPKPAIFLELAKKLGLSPDEAVVVGDADVDMEGGKIGKFSRTIQFLSDPGQEESKNADFVIRDLLDVLKLLK